MKLCLMGAKMGSEKVNLEKAFSYQSRMNLIAWGVTIDESRVMKVRSGLLRRSRCLKKLEKVQN